MKDRFAESDESREPVDYLMLFMLFRLTTCIYTRAADSLLGQRNGRQESCDK